MPGLMAFCRFAPSGRIPPLRLSFRLRHILLACERVYVVGKPDRCLYAMLANCSIRSFLEACRPGTREQLLLAARDLSLVEQSLMRSDEMRIVQRNIEGRSVGQPERMRGHAL